MRMLTPLPSKLKTPRGITNEEKGAAIFNGCPKSLEKDAQKGCFRTFYSFIIRKIRRKSEKKGKIWINNKW